MVAPDIWKIEVKGSMRAHFNQAKGPSRPGMDWSVALRRNFETKTVMVRAFEHAVLDAPPEQGARLIVQYVQTLLASGWSPDRYQGKPGELIYSSNLHEVAKAVKPWWKFW